MAILHSVEQNSLLALLLKQVQCSPQRLAVYLYSVYNVMKSFFTEHSRLLLWCLRFLSSPRSLFQPSWRSSPSTSALIKFVRSSTLYSSSTWSRDWVLTDGHSRWTAAHHLLVVNKSPSINYVRYLVVEGKIRVPQVKLSSWPKLQTLLVSPIHRFVEVIWNLSWGSGWFRKP